MKFAIGLDKDFKQAGFDTKIWRKSVDGELALVHADHALPAIERTLVTVYDAKDPQFMELLASPEWVKDEYETDPTNPETDNNVDETV